MMWRRVWVENRTGKRGPHYRLRWYDVDGQQRSENVGSDGEHAESERRRKEAEINSPGYREVYPIALKGFAQEHLELMDGEVRPASLKEHREALARLMAFFGDRRELATITVSDAMRYFKARRESVRVCDQAKAEEDRRHIRPATVNKELRTVRAIFNSARTQGYMRDNPFECVNRLREPERDLRVLTVKEVESLLVACPDEAWQAFLTLAVTTGMRLREMTHLEWTEVDFERGLIAVRNKDGHETKSGRQRQVGLVSRAAIALRRIHGERRFVFETRDGKPWEHNLHPALRKIVTRAGIAHCTFHDLRRTFTTQMRLQGASSSVTRAATGHASLEVMEQYYTAVSPEDVRRAAERLPWAKGITPISPQVRDSAG